MKLKTIDIPQADSLGLVRRLLDVISASEDRSAKNLAERSKFSERHVRYRTQAARILGFLSGRERGTELTARGRRLLGTQRGSEAEKMELRRAVEACPIVRQIAPNFLAVSQVDVQAITAEIMALSGLARSTAERRAIVLRAWHRDLV